jgi:hypothetical protein
MATQWTAGTTSGQVLTAATLNTIGAAWETYTPTVKGGATTLTGTVLYARYARLAKTVWVQVAFQSTSAGAANGIISVSYPSGLTPVNTDIRTIGTFHILDSGTAWYTGSASASNPCQGLAYGGGNYMGNNTPAMTVANNDVISISVCYEVA